MKKEANYIELFSVLFLVGVLVGVIWPGWTTVTAAQKDRSDLETCRRNLDTIRLAIEDYERRNKARLPKSLSELMSGKNPPLKELPLCPAVEGKRSTYEGPSAYEFREGAVPRFTVRCAGANHTTVGLKKDEPYYDSLYGLKP